MSPPKEIYRLRKILDNPKFEGFGSVDRESLLGRDSGDEDLYPGYNLDEEYPNWKPVKFNGIWKPLKVEGRVTPFNDYPCINLSRPAFSQRACEVLRDLLEPNGELLPLSSETDVKYFFYNITTFSDAFDMKKSRYELLDDAGIIALNIDYFEFQKKKLDGLSIFRIYQYPVGTFVTDEFVRRVHEAGLNGFAFTRIWPFPPGVNWEDEELKQERALRKTKGEVKKHALVFILPLHGAKPDKQEKALIKQRENELDAILKVQGMNDPYFGSYEGHDIVDGEYRMFMSCPDVDQLAQKIHAWLHSFDWPVKVHLMKRYGDMYDENAKESVISF
jgi:hypothetical protein